MSGVAVHAGGEVQGGNVIGLTRMAEESKLAEVRSRLEGLFAKAEAEFGRALYPRPTWRDVSFPCRPARPAEPFRGLAAWLP